MLEITNSQKRKAYSIKNAAVQLDVSVPYIRNLIRAGDLQAKKTGRKLLILDSTLSEFLETREDFKPISKEEE